MNPKTQPAAQPPVEPSVSAEDNPFFVELEPSTPEASTPNVEPSSTFVETQDRAVPVITKVVMPDGQEMTPEEADKVSLEKAKRPVKRSDPEYYDGTYHDEMFQITFFFVIASDELLEIAEDFPARTAESLGMDEEELKKPFPNFPDRKAARQYRRLEEEMFDGFIAACVRRTDREELNESGDFTDIPSRGGVKKRLFETIFAKSEFDLDQDAWFQLRAQQDAAGRGHSRRDGSTP